jgi:hypothetical protein
MQDGVPKRMAATGEGKGPRIHARLKTQDRFPAQKRYAHAPPAVPPTADNYGTFGMITGGNGAYGAARPVQLAAVSTSDFLLLSQAELSHGLPIFLPTAPAVLSELSGALSPKIGESKEE